MANRAHILRHNRMAILPAIASPDSETTQWEMPPGAGQTLPPHSSRPPLRGGTNRTLLAAAGGVGVLLVAAVIGLVLFRASFDGKIYDNTYVRDVNIGGLTPTAAKAELAQTLTPYLTGTVALSYADKRWTPTYADLGMRLDLDQSVTEAYASGRSGGPIGTMWRAYQLRAGAKAFIPLYVRVDNTALDGYLDGLTREIGTPPKDATIAVKGKEIVTTPGADGIKLDRTLVRQQLVDGVANLRTTALTLPVTFAPPTISTEQAEQAKAKADALVGAPLALTFEGRAFPLTQDDLIGALRFDETLTPRIDTAVFSPKVENIAKQVLQEPQDAVIGWDNRLVVRQPAKNGQRLNVDETMARLAAWKGDVREIALPVEVAKPRIPDDVGALGITTRLARGVSNFTGSDAARASNIATAAKYLDNTIVAPGETFSFLDAIGAITVERGYKDGYVILAEQTVPGIGGGVCQVSTTMFRAIMYSGLPVVERNPHAYLIRFYEQGGYPVGLEAAVFSPAVDLKFENVTGKYLLIKTAIDNGNLAISIYGPEVDYKVEISDPVVKNKKDSPPDEYEVDPKLPPGSKRQVEIAKVGEDVSITRTVRDSSGAILRQGTFNTRYQPWPNKFLVSRDMLPGNAPKTTSVPNNPTAPAKATITTTPTATLPKPQATPTAAKPVATVAPTKKP